METPREDAEKRTRPKMLFSARRDLAEEVNKWYIENPEVERCPMSTIASLQALGYRIVRSEDKP